MQYSGVILQLTDVPCFSFFIAVSTEHSLPSHLVEGTSARALGRRNCSGASDGPLAPLAVGTVTVQEEV